MSDKYIKGDKFTRAWINQENLPGSMMQGPQGLYGPVPASTSVWITTGERECELMKSKGPVLEVFTKDAQRYEILKEAGDALIEAKEFEAYEVIYKMMKEAEIEKLPPKSPEGESAPKPKEWVAQLRKELLMSKMTHNYTFSRDEVIELLGGKFALLAQ